MESQIWHRPSLARTLPGQSIPPYPHVIVEVSMSLSVLMREERKTVFVLIFFNFTVMKSQLQEKQDQSPPPSPHTPGIRLNIVSIFLTASQSLNINLPVIGGENKQAIKNVTELTFSFLCLALPFHFAPTA